MPPATVCCHYRRRLKASTSLSSSITFARSAEPRGNGDDFQYVSCLPSVNHFRQLFILDPACLAKNYTARPNSWQGKNHDAKNQTARPSSVRIRQPVLACLRLPGQESDSQSSLGSACVQCGAYMLLCNQVCLKPLNIVALTFWRQCPCCCGAIDELLVTISMLL